MHLCKLESFLPLCFQRYCQEMNIQQVEFDFQSWLWIWQYILQVHYLANVNSAYICLKYNYYQNITKLLSKHYCLKKLSQYWMNLSLLAYFVVIWHFYGDHIVLTLTAFDIHSFALWQDLYSYFKIGPTDIF